MSNPKKFVILDFGSQYTNLIKSNLSKLGYSSLIIPGDENYLEFKQKENIDIGGIILSGGASSVYDGTINFDNNWINVESIPVLGICYGHQLIANSSGGNVKSSKTEFGRSNINLLLDDDLFSGINKNFEAWMSHGDSVINLPNTFEILAKSSYSEIASYRSKDKRIRGIQFHPEVTHTKDGLQILENFCSLICKVTKDKPWTAKDFVEVHGKQIRNKIRDDKVLIALSGGVDSMTLAAFLRKFLEKRSLQAVYVDTGLMPDNTKMEVVDFCKMFDIQLEVIDASEKFFECLVGIIDPKEKGRKIGFKFIEIFEEYSNSLDIKYLAQGTIWSDVVESGVTKFSSQIKPHHNVACLPDKMNIILLEPFRELFKNQVREIAKELLLPENIVNKKVFPGPGFAIRVQGEVTKEKVELVRKSTKIIEDVIENSEINKFIWMGFSILIDVPSLGVKGDSKVINKHAIVVRIVESENSMTAIFSRRVMDILPEISTRILDETTVGRVVYDITDKPPGTIEWQ